jgi:hypothetical protein
MKPGALSYSSGGLITLGHRKKNKMILRRATRASFGLMAVLYSIASAQTPQSTVLTIEMENVVRYNENFASPARNGTSTTMEAQTATPATFFPGTFLGDIVAVNGRKSKGAGVARIYTVNLASNPSGSQAIADINRFQTMDVLLEIQQADGTSIGAIVLSGMTGGEAPLGAPKSGGAGAFAVIGGTGAFLGARGQAATIMNSHRSSSTLENPINRRAFASGLWKLVIQLIPLRTPEVALTATGPVIVHSGDYSLVTAAKPARAGEVLTLFASGLGPTRPGVDPGQVFTASPVQVASSPIDVLVNGKAGEVLYAGGYPNTVDSYQVNFRIPGDTAPGTTAIQLSAAWIVGAEVRIPVQ